MCSWFCAPWSPEAEGADSVLVVDPDLGVGHAGSAQSRKAGDALKLLVVLVQDKKQHVNTSG